MTLGTLSSDVVMPIIGSDRITMGLSPTSMHLDPSGLSAPVAVIVAPASSGISLWLIVALALGGWYAYKQGWLGGLA